MSRLRRLAAAPWGLVGMLALVALAERGAARVEMDLMLPQHWDWRQAARAARVEAPKADILLFGDSLLKFGVHPRVVAARTGRPTYSLAVVLGQPAASYVLLRRALDAGARPKAILFDAAPHVFALPPGAPQMARQWPELFTGPELFDLARTAGDPALFGREALARVLPVLRNRAGVRETVTAALRGEPPLRRWNAARFARNTRVNLGATGMDVVPPVPGPDEGPGGAYPAVRAFEADPVSVAYLERFLDLAASRRIPVFWVLPPAAAATQQFAVRSGQDAAHTRFVARYLDRYPNLSVIDGRRAGFGRELYYLDPVHLNSAGAAALSDLVSDALARALDGSKGGAWVGRVAVLPPRRPAGPGAGTRPDPIERLAVSTAALADRADAGAGGTARR